MYTCTPTTYLRGCPLYREVPRASLCVDAFPTHAKAGNLDRVILTNQTVSGRQIPES